MAEPSATPIVPTLPEEWRPIPGFEGRYAISNHGRVRIVFSGRRREIGRIMAHQKNHFGYAYVPLRVTPPRGKRRAQRKVFVHLTVATVFMGPRPEGLHTAHLDGNGMNPCLENLAYVTPGENLSHREVHGTMPDMRGERASGAKLSNQDAAEIRRLRTEDRLSFYEIGRRYGVSHETARCICRGLSFTNVELPACPQDGLRQR